jgi:hypothetical protein
MKNEGNFSIYKIYNTLLKYFLENFWGKIKSKMHPGKSIQYFHVPANPHKIGKKT